MSQQINLFNPVFLKQEKVFTALHMAQTAGLVLAGALLIVAYGAYRTNELEKSVAAAQARITVREAALAKANAEFSPREKNRLLESETQRLTAELASLREVEGVLKGGELGNTVGYSEYFRAFARQNVPGLWLTGLGIVGAGKDISVQGKAMQAGLVPGYIARLTQEPVMRGKTFGSLQIGSPEAAAMPAPAVGSAQDGKAQAPSFVEFRLQSQAVGAPK